MDFPENCQGKNRLYELAVKAGDEWQNTFDSIPHMICILDRDAKIIRVNRSFCALLKKPPDALIGARCSDVIPTFSAALSPRSLKPVPAAEEAPQREQDVEIGGTRFAASIFPYYDAVGGLRGAIHIFRDITEQYRLADQLVQAEKMAAIGTLAAEIAHELNNPLHYINNYLYLLFESLPADFAKKEYVEKIQTGIDNLAQLTKDLLEFSRPQVDPLLPVNLRLIIDASLEPAGKRISENRIEVVRRYGHGDRLIMGSERMFRQVFENLIQNALDALLPEGRIVFTTFCDQTRFIVEVEDTGAGITAKNLAKIFDPFFTTKKGPERRGTGLGLAICYNVIKQLGGDISVSSKEGQGTKFIITLPIES